MSKLRTKSCLTACMLMVFFILLGMHAALAQNTAIANEQESQMTTAHTEPAGGELLYSDDFASSKSGWPIYSSGDLLTTYKKGKYHITVVPENYWDGVLAPRLNLTDFVLEVEANKEAGPDDNVYGVWVRNMEAGSFYAFLISSDGYYDFAKKENGTWVTPSNWTKSGDIKTGNETNLIRVEAQGPNLAFYANGARLADYTDDSFAYGGVGLWTGSQSEGNVTIGFDNFKIWSINDSRSQN